MGKSAGAQPDFRGAAEQQGQSSQQAVNTQTQANRPNTNSPFSSEQWTKGPDGSWQRDLGLSGGLGTGASALGAEFGAATSTPLDPSLFGGVADGSQARNQAIDAEFGQAVSRLNPMWDQRENQERSRLANMGLDPNSEAARTSMGSLGRERNDAYTSALNSAIGSGREAGTAVFNQNVASNQLALANALRRRSAPLEMMGQLRSFFDQPGFTNAGAGDATNYFGAATANGNWQQQDADRQNQFWGDLAGGIMGAAGSAAKLSDARAKTDIRRLPIEAMPGVPFATWQWAEGHEGSGPTFGVIAQDLQKVAPHLVRPRADGFLTVDYSFLRKD